MKEIVVKFVAAALGTAMLALMAVGCGGVDATEATPPASQPEQTESVPTQQPTEVTQEQTQQPAHVPVELDMSNALFIGDSRTVGLMEYSGLESDFFASVGMSVYNVEDEEVSVPNVGKVTLDQLLSNREYDTIYLMLGINELGYDMDQTVDVYTEQWFTLKLRVSLATGSGNTYYEYYHVDRRTGKIVKLEDLFDGDAYRPVIEENIREQMRRQMEEDENVAYFIKMESFGKDFVEVDEDHNFYFNAQGELVIPFDKYEIAPGSMGCPEFTIPTDLIRGEIREEYQEIFRDPQA